MAENLGFDLPLGVFGAGLSIAHRGGIVVNGDARIGGGCRIHQGVTIGAVNGKAPVIGNDVFIGPNAGVFGGVIVGSGAVIGPHALVDFDVPDGCLVTSGRGTVRLRSKGPWRNGLLYGEDTVDG